MLSKRDGCFLEIVLFWIMQTNQVVKYKCKLISQSVQGMYNTRDGRDDKLLSLQKSSSCWISFCTGPPLQRLKLYIDLSLPHEFLQQTQHQMSYKYGLQSCSITKKKGLLINFFFLMALKIKLLACRNFKYTCINYHVVEIRPS